jgi:hypothetical protein
VFLISHHTLRFCTPPRPQPPFPFNEKNERPLKVEMPVEMLHRLDRLQTLSWRRSRYENIDRGNGFSITFPNVHYHQIPFACTLCYLRLRLRNIATENNLRGSRTVICKKQPLQLAAQSTIVSYSAKRTCKRRPARGWSCQSCPPSKPRRHDSENKLQFERFQHESRARVATDRFLPPS